jgi:hypothetical protein
LEEIVITCDDGNSLGEVGKHYSRFYGMNKNDASDEFAYTFKLDKQEASMQ